MSLFDDPRPRSAGAGSAAGSDAGAPLAERMRPRSLEEYVGQGHVLAEGSALRRAIDAGRAGSLLLWGPPGTGKTTLARLIAQASGLAFEPFSAVLGGVKEVRAAVARAEDERALRGRGTLLFVDEIHRFNRAQQDAFLPHVESGKVVLVGATTENPSFSVNAALLSRCRLVTLRALDDDAIAELVDRALADSERGLGRRGLRLDPVARERLVATAAGDARRALTVLEAAAASVADGAELDVEEIADAAQQRALAHDKAGDHHFDLLSALHKSLRNSDVEASVYWLARFLEAGADPMQAARRMIAVASEDVGLADPMSLQVAVAAQQALHVLGLPEGRLPLTQAAIHLAVAPKSNAVIRAIDAASRLVRDGAQHPIPLHLRNAPTRLAEEAGHGAGYLYAHDQPGGVADMDCLPDALVGRRKRFYEPGERGFERRVRERLDEIARAREES
jgi:putative ATPase